ncbi:MAG: helix-turn-helix domain-containing protein [Bacteroidota bacterium]
MNLSENNEAAATALQFVNSTNRHVFLTGKAGTGKTTFLKEIIHLTHKNVIIAAPTGIAAINAGGVTLHSLFQLPFGTFIPSNEHGGSQDMSFKMSTPRLIIENLQMNSTKRNMLKELELLIIDEVSMLRADILDAIDVVLKHIRRRRNTAFGGVQILFIGDMLQLPPVVKDAEWGYLKNHYQGMFFFEALALKQSKPVYIELEKIFRQTNQTFISILNNLRENKISESDINTLNQYHKPDFQPKPDEGYVFLTTHNYKADSLNADELKKIDKKTYKYRAEIVGDFADHMFPLEEILELKKGAQVMFVKNDYSGEKRYFNGKIGTVYSLSSDSIEVDFNDGSEKVTVDKYTWENKKYSLDKETNEITESVKGSFTHYPLKLAWAITVHKSQGLTFEKAMIDVSRAFAPGQVYVALSRLTSLEGLVLTEPIRYNGLKQDELLNEFAESKGSKEELDTQFNEGLKAYINGFVKYAFDFEALSNQYYYHLKSYTKDEKKSVKQKYHPWASELQKQFQEPLGVSKKFLLQIDKIARFNADDYLSVLFDRVQAAKKHFEPILKGFSDKIFSKINELKSETRVKKYMNELKDVERLFFGQLQKIHKAEALLEATIKDTNLTKEQLTNSELYKNREEQIPEITKSKKKSIKSNTPKEKKPKTREVSFELFQQGKSLEEIAKERSLVITTIESHLSTYVAQGKLDVNKFVDKNKREKIIKAAEKLETYNLGPIKHELGSEYTYSELRFAMAHSVYLKSKE